MGRGGHPKNKGRLGSVLLGKTLTYYIAEGGKESAKMWQKVIGGGKRYIHTQFAAHFPPSPLPYIKKVH